MMNIFQSCIVLSRRKIPVACVAGGRSAIIDSIYWWPQCTPEQLVRFTSQGVSWRIAKDVTVNSSHSSIPFLVHLLWCLLFWCLPFWCIDSQTLHQRFLGIDCSINTLHIFRNCADRWYRWWTVRQNFTSCWHFHPTYIHTPHEVFCDYLPHAIGTLGNFTVLDWSGVRKNLPVTRETKVSQRWL